MTQRSSWKATYSKMALAMVALLSAPAVWAQSADPKEWQLNMGRGVTQTARMAYEAHMVALWVCVVIGALVFGAMGYAIFKFRKSKGAVAAQFSHNTTAEVLWTVIPVLVLIAMAWPATAKLIAMYDTRESEMTVKVTGYQWMWKYEYLGQGVEFTSRLRANPIASARVASARPLHRSRIIYWMWTIAWCCRLVPRSVS